MSAIMSSPNSSTSSFELEIETEEYSCLWDHPDFYRIIAEGATQEEQEESDDCEEEPQMDETNIVVASVSEHRPNSFDRIRDNAVLLAELSTRYLQPCVLRRNSWIKRFHAPSNSACRVET